MTRQDDTTALRVLHVLCDLNGGGAERMVLELCRRAGPGVRSEVAVVHGETVHGGPDLGPSFSLAGVPVHVAGRIRGRPGVVAVARLAALARRFDVVHTHLWAGDTWGRVAALLAGRRPVVSTEHNTRAEDPWRQRVSTAMAPLSRVVVCVSGAAEMVALEAGHDPSRLRVIANGIDVDWFAAVTRPSPGAGGPLSVLGIGRLTRQKGFDLLVDALRSLPEATLTLVGEGEERSELEAAAVGLPVTFAGWSDDVRPFLARADVVVLPSRWEGFGLAAAEAMAAGVPVIAAAVDGLVEVVGDAGLLVPPEDVGALRDALAALGADPDRRRRLSEEGRRAAARFDIAATVAAYESLYREVAGRGAGE